MKVEVKEKTEKEIEYPCLMKSDDGMTVLMTSDKVGIVIIDRLDCDWNVGYYHNDWTMSRFKLFNGSVTLSND